MLRHWLEHLHIGAGHLAGEQRIFGIVFKVPASQWVAVTFIAGARRMSIPNRGFTTVSSSYLVDQISVPEDANSVAIGNPVA